MSRTLLTVALLLGTTVLAQPAPLQRLFAYDAKAPLELKELSRERRDRALVRDITFRGHPDSLPVRAFLVSPAEGKGPFAAVLFVHWLGDPKTTNRTQFLDQAIGLAGRGAVSLLIDAMWSKPKWFSERDPDDDPAASRRQVVDLLRAEDLLLSQPDVDRKRYAFVGHDYGAMFGILSGATAHRPKTYVLLAPTTRFENWALLGPAPKALKTWREQMAVLDPIEHVSALAPATVLFQFSTWDRYVPLNVANRFFNAAGKPKRFESYDVDHGLSTKTGALDRFNWLARELELER